MSISINNICRLCMCSENKLLPLFGSSKNLCDKIHTISSVIEINAGDGLPAQVCQHCVCQIDISYNFKLQCEMSDAALRHYLSHPQHKETQDCFKSVESKHKGPVAAIKMKGHEFGDVTAITPHCVENLTLEWGQTITNLQRNATEMQPDVISDCNCDTAESHDAVSEQQKWHGPGHQQTADKANLKDMKIMSIENDTSSAKSQSGVCTAGNASAPSTSAVLRYPVEETHSVSSREKDNVCQRVYQWEHDESLVQSSGNSQYNYALRYWDKQFEETGNNNLTTAALQQWIMSNSEKNYCSENNGNNAIKSLTVKKPVGRPKQSVENVKYHQCPLCGKSIQRLSLHMRMHTGDRPYQCSQCGQRFTQLGSLKKHQTLHSEEKPFHCNVCGKCFRCKSDLSLHSKLHTGKSFDCSYCNKSFVTQKAIDNHVRIHTGEKPYLCHVCGMSFSQEGNLSMHVKVHTGEKPFQCLVCSKFFATRTHLEKHTRTHTGEKPYTCATCLKSFSDRGYFMRHLAVHTGEKSHVCGVCNKAFTQRISLKRHARIHTGEKPFECVICKEAFSLKRDLKRHCEKVHNEDKVIPLKHQLEHFQHFAADLNEHTVGCHQY